MVELERASQRVDDLARRVTVTTALEAQIVVGTDAGEHRELFASETRDSPRAGGADPRLLGSDALAAGAKVAAERVRSLLFEGCQGCRRGVERGACQAPVCGGFWPGVKHAHSVANVIQWRRISRRKLWA